MDTKNQSKSKNGNEKKKTFYSKNIKHDPQAESARTVFGLNNTDDNEK